MYQGNYLLQGSEITEQDTLANTYFTQIVNSLVDRVFNDIYLGSGAPNAALGEVNDAYIDLSGLDVYLKDSTGWDAGTALDNNANTVLLIGPK